MVRCRRIEITEQQDLGREPQTVRLRSSVVSSASQGDDPANSVARMRRKENWKRNSRCDDEQLRFENRTKNFFGVGGYFSEAGTEAEGFLQLRRPRTYQTEIGSESGSSFLHNGNAPQRISSGSSLRTFSTGRVDCCDPRWMAQLFFASRETWSPRPA